MADRGDTHYHIPGLNLWFAVSSLVLLISALWMVVDDWSRSWKGYQREFRSIEAQRAREELASAESGAALEQEKHIEGVLAEARARVEARGADLEEAEAKLRELEGKRFTTTEAEKKSKQAYNWERFQVEEGHSQPESLAQLEAAWNAAVEEREGAIAAAAAQAKVVAALRAEVSEVETRLKAAVKDVDLVRKRLAKLAPEDFPTKVANIIRDFPGLDFIGPNLKVRKVILENLTFELNFTKKQRIDQCMTCHVAIDLEGYEGDLPHPFRSHPRLDLYLTAKSPHPLKDVGCTICHRGSGEALEFVRADHRPSDEAEAEEWEREYHWHKQHHWDYPMLSSEYVEASCVQCHKTSMELIADEIPRVTKGFQLFERYGCYACHKVDWFPATRLPGPSLKKLGQKVASADWVASWVADPKGFRPSTWMPQIFHLENYPPEAKVVDSEYGKGRPIYGQEWNDAIVASVAAFVWDRTSKEPAPPIPLEGDPVRGRETFRLVGCLACHNMAPFPGEEPESSDLALQRRDTNEHGPSLRGIATKVTPQWLYSWIRDPAAYWPETRMPNLRLDEGEAADVVAYVFDDPEGYFGDVPEGWTVAPGRYEREVVAEIARWFYNRKSRAEIRRLLDDEWSSDQALLVAVGEKLVTNHGCHSCHEIPGLEDVMPIGTELTNWGSKTVDKLDKGFVPEILGEANGWSYHQIEEFKLYREGWLEQKLHEPRSYDRNKVKTPLERLKMPWFDLEPDEVAAIATFVVGLVDDEVQHARMEPTPGELSMDRGMRVIRQKNCAGCHVIEPGTITYLDEDGRRRTVSGEVFPLDSEEVNPPPLGPGFHGFVADWEDAVEEELEEVIVRLLRPEPGVGDVGDTVVIEEDLDGIETTAAWGGGIVPLIVEYYRNPWRFDDESEDYVSNTADPEGEGRVADVDGQFRPYEEEPYEKIRWTFAPPILIDEGYKLQPEWFYRFLLDPVPLRRQMRVRMPSFRWTPGEAAAVADYFAHAATKDWPSRSARKLLLALDASEEEVGAQMEAAGIKGISPGQIRGIVAGSRPDIEAGLDKLMGFAVAKGFSFPRPVDPDYEAIPARAPSVLDPILGADPGFFDRIHRLAGPEGPNCFQCHYLNGVEPVAEGPIAWAPDLFLVRDRLRQDWVREWLTDPSRIYPGTAMPANFPLDQDVFQNLLPLPSAKQIEAVLVWLFNLDRAGA